MQHEYVTRFGMHTVWQKWRPKGGVRLVPYQSKASVSDPPLAQGGGQLSKRGRRRALDRLGEAFQPVTADDQHVAHPPVSEPGEDAEPERGAFTVRIADPLDVVYPILYIDASNIKGRRAR